MKNLIKNLILVLILVSFSGCARWWESTTRGMEGDAYYRIVRHSGGEITAMWDFEGLPNSSADSDGYYFEYMGRTVEVAGNVDVYRDADEYTARMWKQIYGKDLPVYKKHN